MVKLTAIEEQAILLTYVRGMSDVQAYKATHPKASDKTAKSAASPFFAKVRAKLTDASFLELLKVYNLGPPRLVQEINKRLGAKTPIVFKGSVTGEYDDNLTQMRATELLARIHGIGEKTQQKPESAAQEDGTIKIIID